MVVVVSNRPVDPYVWPPLTLNGPPSGPITVPGELEPSPHAIVAVYSDAMPLGSASAKVAMVALKDIVEFAGVAQLAERGASATFTVDVTVVLVDALSASLTYAVTA